MKHLILSSAAILSAFSLSSLAAAQDDTVNDDVIEEVVKPEKPKKWFVYADANIATTQFSDTDGNTTFVSDSATSSYFRAGIKYKYFGAEFELGNGLSDIEEDGVSIGVSSQTSAFAIVRTPGEKYDVYLRAGYHSSKVEVGAQIFNPQTGQQVAVNDELDSDGFAAGVGGTYYFTDNFGLRADITGYNTRDLVDAGFVAASIGGTVRF